MDTEHKLLVLAALARAFRERQVVWAVGGSLLLYLKGRCETFHDLDILVAEGDIDAAREACLSLGELLRAVLGVLPGRKQLPQGTLYICIHETL